jgi:hypothetical protein
MAACTNRCSQSQPAECSSPRFARSAENRAILSRFSFARVHTLTAYKSRVHTGRKHVSPPRKDVFAGRKGVFAARKEVFAGRKRISMPRKDESSLGRTISAVGSMFLPIRRTDPRRRSPFPSVGSPSRRQPSAVSVRATTASAITTGAQLRSRLRRPSELPTANAWAPCLWRLPTTRLLVKARRPRTRQATATPPARARTLAMQSE